MQIKNTKLKGLKIINNKIYRDSRGYFKEDFKASFFKKIRFIFSCTSKSKKNVLRGMHVQTKKPQGKFVSVLKGSILDVAIDLRPDSKTYRKYVSIILDDKKKEQLFIPKGFGHAFLTLSKTAIISYKVDNFYNKQADSGIKYDDPSININWKLEKHQILLSDRDNHLSFL